MKMVQSWIALACLLAGADAFGPMPHHTHEEPDTHEVPHHTHESESPPPSASPSPPPSAPVVIVPKFNEYKDVCVDLNEYTMWTTESTSDYGTAKECWEACQAHGEQNPGANPNPVPSHEFLDWTKVAGIGTQCICKTSCDCFDENIAPELLPEHLMPEYDGVHTTLALPDWEGCTVPALFSVHKGWCDNFDADILEEMFLNDEKAWVPISTQTMCWKTCESSYPWTAQGKVVAHKFIVSGIEEDKFECRCRKICTCWNDGPDAGPDAVSTVTLAKLDWMPPDDAGSADCVA